MLEITVFTPQHAALKGRFDASQVDNANDKFEGLGGGQVLLDFAELDYIASAGISSLLLLYRRLNEQGHDIRISNANGHVKNIFEGSGLQQLFPMD